MWPAFVFITFLWAVHGCWSSFEAALVTAADTVVLPMYFIYISALRKRLTSVDHPRVTLGQPQEQENTPIWELVFLLLALPSFERLFGCSQGGVTCTEPVTSLGATEKATTL